eukprot:SAG31_NODE_10323_length_1153_cov_3.046490_2_plen_66_part_01
MRPLVNEFDGLNIPSYPTASHNPQSTTLQHTISHLLLPAVLHHLSPLRLPPALLRPPHRLPALLLP